MRYLRLQPNSQLLPYEGVQPFGAIVAIEVEVTSEWRWQVSKWLVEHGCLNMLAWGHDCSHWDDSVDYANLEAFSYGDIPDERRVMTTWHEGESLSEVMNFAKHNMIAMSDNVEIRETVLLHISDTDKQREFELLFAAA
jgi:hypothetical protein